MDLMLERTSVTYLLSFEPKYQEADGSYHAITIEPGRLTRGIYGVELIVRDGEQDLVARTQFEVMD